MLKKLFLALTLIIFLLFIAATASFYFAPAIGIKLANSWYSKQGEGYSLEAESWQFSPFKAQLSLKNVKLIHPNQQEGETFLAQVNLVIQPKHLLHKHLLVESLLLKGFATSLNYQINAKETQLQVAGLNFPLTTQSSTLQQEERNKTPSQPFAINLEEVTLENFNLAWRFTDTSKTQALTSQGKVKLNKLAIQNLTSLATTNLPVSLNFVIEEFNLANQEEISLLKPLKVEVKGELTNLASLPSWQGKVQINQLALALLTNNEKNNVLLEAEEFSAKELNLNQEQLSLALAELKNLNLEQATAKVNLSHLSLEEVNYLLTENIFSLARLNLTSLDETPSQLKYTDTSVKPAAKIKLQVNQLEAQSLEGSLSPNGELSLSPIEFNLNLGVGEFGSITSQGKLGLINQAGAYYPEGQFNLQANQLDAVDFNGYLIQALGYQLDHGSLDLTAQVQLQQAELKADVDLLLRNSKFTPANTATIEKISKQISMPLETSINLLRDKHGNLALKLPISGKLNQPNFSWQPLINKVTTKALAAGSIFVIKQSLQPFSTFVSLGYLAGEYAFAIRLNALAFAEQKVELTPEHLAALEKLGQLMQQKAKLEITACPFVNPLEAEALAEDWQDLAVARGLVVKAWLEENYPKEAKRLTRCRPQIGKQAEVVLGVR